MHTTYTEYEFDPANADANWRKHDIDGHLLDRTAQGHAGNGEDLAETTGKERFPLWLDSDVLSHFRKLAVNQETGFQGLINQTLRDAMDSDNQLNNDAGPHEAALRDDGPARLVDPEQAVGKS